MHQLCVCAVNSIVSPFVLHDMALEAAHYLSPDNHYGTNGGMVMQHLRTTLTPLVHKCQQMWVHLNVDLVIVNKVKYVILRGNYSFGGVGGGGSAKFKKVFFLQNIYLYATLGRKLLWSMFTKFATKILGQSRCTRRVCGKFEI